MEGIPWCPVVGTQLFHCWVLGSIPGWGTRSHMHAATKSSHATMKIPHATMKIPHVATKDPACRK